MDFLILFQANAQAPLEICDVITGKKKNQGEQAIQEATTKGEGEYIAVQFDDSVITRKQAVLGLELTEPTTEPAPEPEEPEANKGE